MGHPVSIWLYNWIYRLGVLGCKNGPRGNYGLSYTPLLVNLFRMKQLLITLVLAPLVFCQQEFLQERGGRNLSVFNVVSFPNSVCGATNGFNGTCYTASECTSLGGTASGTCASSFGVCCVFNLLCGATTSANTTYATINTFSTSTDADPCTYTYCKNNDDVCKLR